MFFLEGVIFLFVLSNAGANAASRLQVIHDEEANLIVATPDEYDAVVIMIHGLGDTGKSYIQLADMMSAQLPKVKFILPSAPEQPVTLNGGKRMSSWYDIISLQDKDGGDCDGLIESAARIRKILENEHNKGIPYNRMVLSGIFSFSNIIHWLKKVIHQKNLTYQTVSCRL
uniref:Phospholipase/carboxylesterase/thioesterase domain-containing protein n=1 Tax=Aplanochytrium stocchinoi TaxID=215587 RepID=A0A6S8AZ68_9STRA|mmetsp:Transcript_15672/g.19426  ORF Transcript_15672/g.19426 Transcript_15672/m.19426 type:complete len:171 (-) Transcript_15672:750-1262(-)